MTLPLAGARIRSADMATIFPAGTDAWQSFTPTLVQPGAVTKTVNSAQYMKIGRLVIVNYYLTVTGTGTAASVVLIGLPFASATPGLAGAGSGMIFDSSAGTFYAGTAIINDPNTIKIATNASLNYLGAASFTAALAVNDIVSAFVAYQATS